MGRRPLHPAWSLAVAALAAGCELRDEEPRSGPAFPWPTLVADRLAEPVADATLPGRPRIDFVDGFAAGSRRAAEAQRPLLVVFRASWCRWSGDFQTRLAADERLATLADDVVWATVDADREADACRSFGVSGFPTVILLDAEGEELFRATGGAAAAGLAAALESLTRGPGRLAGDRAAPR